VRITNGQARIVAFGSVPTWLHKHGARLRDEMRALGLMWDQRHSNVPGDLSVTALSD
jgi:branched-chain amino acid transport system substrate-binding protein